MDTVNLGRKLGIGTRVAGKMLRARAQNASSGSPSSATNAPTANAPPQEPPQPGQETRRARPIDPRAATRNVTRGVVRGGLGFGRGFWKPFARAVHGLWHEVTGVFFAIFAVFFAQSLWRVRGDWQAGAQHHRFLAYLIFTLVFAYFSITAFVSSRRTHH